jgi:8-oxo-dGTP pyrophosphatase MutT (NUDIX family)
MWSHSWDVLARLPRQPAADMITLAEARRPDDPVARPAPSASVILLRDGPSGLETYLLHRHARMPFAASAVVFPGGRVDAVDVAAGGDPARACALRETAEETGVQLTGDDLVPWAHWITPEPEPRRYDTRFFLAALPDGQHAQDLSGETDYAGWELPTSALAEADRGDYRLMPPTRAILLELVEARSVRELLDAATGRMIECVLPQIIKTASGWTLRYPSRSGKGTLADDH